MLGATLRVKSRLADLCRANSSVATLVLDINDGFIDVLSIETTSPRDAHSLEVTYR